MVLRADRLFQSTLPGWGATEPSGRTHRTAQDFNPRSPDGERPQCGEDTAWDAGISIHAPRMGSDTPGCATSPLSSLISIHAPRMGSDRQHEQDDADDCISIHAPRMGSDRRRGPARGRAARHFNPRSPDGERPVAAATIDKRAEFQSTLPGWGATEEMKSHLNEYRHFNPRSPDGERLCR